MTRIRADKVMGDHSLCTCSAFVVLLHNHFIDSLLALGSAPAFLYYCNQCGLKETLVYFNPLKIMKLNYKASFVSL